MRVTDADRGGEDAVSVVIPTRNEAQRIRSTVSTVRSAAPPGTRVEVIVVADGSTDATAQEAEAAGARVIRTSAGFASREAEPGARRSNPAAARNPGARSATRDPIVFLDADCVPLEGWLSTLLAAHRDGHAAVGGSLALPRGLELSARADYFASAYHVHPRGTLVGAIRWLARPEAPPQEHRPRWG